MYNVKIVPPNVEPKVLTIRELQSRKCYQIVNSVNDVDAVNTIIRIGEIAGHTGLSYNHEVYLGVVIYSKKPNWLFLTNHTTNIHSFRFIEIDIDVDVRITKTYE